MSSAEVIKSSSSSLGCGLSGSVSGCRGEDRGWTLLGRLVLEIDLQAPMVSNKSKVIRFETLNSLNFKYRYPEAATYVFFL